MKGCIWFKVFAVVFLLVCSSWVGASSASGTQVEITDPERDGMKVGKDMDVKGTAEIPGGTYLWVLAHRTKGFKKVWWPQNEAEIDPVTKKWEVFVVFGGPQDIGYDFEIAVIVVDEKENSKLHDYRNKAMATGHWPPIPMPPTADGTAPVIRTVKKVG
jgi:hypothetical protein